MLLWRTGKLRCSERLRAVCLHSARGVVALRGLEVRGPVLQAQVGGLSASFAVEERTQRWRGC